MHIFIPVQILFQNIFILIINIISNIQSNLNCMFISYKQDVCFGLRMDKKLFCNSRPNNTVGTQFEHDIISMNWIWSAADGLWSSTIGNCGLLAALCFGSEEIVTPVWHHKRTRQIPVLNGSSRKGNFSFYKFTILNSCLVIRYVPYALYGRMTMNYLVIWT